MGSKRGNHKHCLSDVSVSWCASSRLARNLTQRSWKLKTYERPEMSAPQMLADWEMKLTTGAASLKEPTGKWKLVDTWELVESLNVFSNFHRSVFGGGAP